MKVTPLDHSWCAARAEGTISTPAGAPLAAPEKRQKRLWGTRRNQTPLPQKAPLTERLKPFRYRPEAGWEPTNLPAIPEGFTPTGGCSLPHNAQVYRSDCYGDAVVNSLVFAGTDLHPQTVDRNKGLLSRPQRPTTRDLSSFRRDARGNNRALGGHLTGNHNRGYQSSTTDLSVAKRFSINRGGGTVSSGWVYSAFVSGVDVAKGREMDKLDKRARAITSKAKATLPYREAKSDRTTGGFKHEREIAVPDGILRDEIVGLRKTKGGFKGSNIRFADTVWVDPNLPDAWYNRVGLSLLTNQGSDKKSQQKEGGPMQTLVSLLFLPLVPLVMALTAPGLLGGLLIEKANEAVLKGRRQAGRRGKLLIVAGTLGRVGGSLCKLAVPTALVFLGFFLMGPTGGLLALCVAQQLFLGDLTSLFKGDFFRQDTFGASDDALFSAKEGEEINTTLLLKLRKGAWEGNGVPGLHSVQYTGLKGITHKRPGLKIEVDHGADIDELTASIIEANPEFAHYTFVDQYQGMDFFPSWFTLFKPRSVAVFRLDTTPE